MHYIPENAHNQVQHSADLLMYADWQKDVKRHGKVRIPPVQINELYAQ
jgi:hypothetical protein